LHVSSFEHMQRLVGTRLDRQQPLHAVDIGAYDVNGSYRTLFDSPHWRYTGIDLEAGPGVDVVLTSPYRFPLATGSVDVVLSGQAFEHIEFFWLTWLEMLRVLKPGGLIFLIAPSRGPEHRYPQDCWRFYPDGYRALARFGGCELLEVSTDWEPHEDLGSAPWGDTVGVFRVSRFGWRRRLALAVVRYLLAVQTRT
jgi:SAM-dependent methyltransferase